MCQVLQAYLSFEHPVTFSMEGEELGGLHLPGLDLAELGLESTTNGYAL